MLPMKNQISPLEVGLCVKNLQAMISFYTETLGFELISEIDVPPDKSGSAGFCSTGYRIVRLQSGYGERLKLVRPVEFKGTSHSNNMVLDRPGNVFLTFIVSDLNNIVAKLKSAELDILTANDICEVREGVYLTNARDPEGNFLEFVEYLDLSTYRSDL